MYFNAIFKFYNIKLKNWWHVFIYSCYGISRSLDYFGLFAPWGKYRANILNVHHKQIRLFLVKLQLVSFLLSTWSRIVWERFPWCRNIKTCNHVYFIIKSFCHLNNMLLNMTSMNPSFLLWKTINFIGKFIRIRFYATQI